MYLWLDGLLQKLITGGPRGHRMVAMQIQFYGHVWLPKDLHQQGPVRSFTMTIGQTGQAPPVTTRDPLSKRKPGGVQLLDFFLSGFHIGITQFLHFFGSLGPIRLAKSQWHEPALLTAGGGKRCSFFLGFKRHHFLRVSSLGKRKGGSPLHLR